MKAASKFVDVRGIHKLRRQVIMGEGGQPDINDTSQTYIVNLSLMEGEWGKKSPKYLLT